ncbi:hypothetical protein B9Y76_17005 [Stenotrophomonas maltophilia]|nr:hypothetical protein [Stenotrophomonas maltophilia]MPS44910.1 hypothetical protein [Stenotrophomonas sp.]PJK96765.1 hypothetical protein B9Y76_17005 [Stenotrophomonas maltophilia]
MDAAAKPPRTGLRRPPQPDPPGHPSGSQLLTLTLPLRVQGRRPCRYPSSRRPRRMSRNHCR